MLILYIDVQFENKCSIVIADKVLKCSRSNCNNELHPENIWENVVTDDVSKFDRSILIKELHPLNKYSIVNTFIVLKLDKFKNCKLEQSMNILFIDFILSVLKFETSRVKRDWHPKNI